MAMSVLMSAGEIYPATAGDCKAGVSPVVIPEDLSRILFVVSDNSGAIKKKELDVQSIKEDIRSAMINAGIQPEITEEKEAITGNRYLKIHIYSILLERQVYFCSVAVIQRLKSSEDECTIIEYSDLTSQARNVRAQTRALVDNIVRNVQ